MTLRRSVRRFDSYQGYLCYNGVMTVQELRQQLEDLPGDTLVVMSKDGEGNGFSPLSEAESDNQMYTPETTWSGEIGLHHLTDELKAQGYTYEDVEDEPTSVPCVVLWPIN